MRIEGELFRKDSRTTRSDSKLVAFINRDGIRIQGMAQWDRYDNCVTIMADSIEKTEKNERVDTYPEKRVGLHAHTKMSAMDGLNDIKHMIKTAEKWGHRAVAITDHGVVQGYQDTVRLRGLSA